MAAATLALRKTRKDELVWSCIHHEYRLKFGNIGPESKNLIAAYIRLVARCHLWTRSDVPGPSGPETRDSERRRAGPDKLLAAAVSKRG
jgi:hypothetical protein